MPTVMRVGPYRFHFCSRENGEPPHIHVARDGFEAKFWLNPVALATSYGFATAEIRDMQRLVEHCAKLLAAYNSYHVR